MSALEGRPIVVKRDPLVVVTCIVVMLALMGQALDRLRIEANVARTGNIDQSAHSTAEAAHITLTNMNNFTVEACFRGVVENKIRGRTESVAVCSGEMKPRTTVVLTAPYPVGDVEKTCPGEPNSFGIKHVNWEQCTFNMVPAYK